MRDTLPPLKTRASHYLSPMPRPDDFKTQVYTALNNVPSGHVVTYGRLAALAGKPNGARQVGTILKQLPPDTRLPWHRVVNAQRQCSFPKGTGRYTSQVERLALDDVAFVNGRIPKHHFM